VKRRAPAVERNREPLLEVLQRVVPDKGLFLEIASGTGEHCVYFAAHLPGLTFLPSDLGSEQLESIEAWRLDAGLLNIRPAHRIDVMSSEPWHDAPVDVVFCANMIHIAPPPALTGLVQGAARHLAPGGLFITYGPYKLGGKHTAPSNERFEEWLRAQDPSFGVRDLEDLTAQAGEVGLRLEETVPMPANNFTVLFRKADD
jgi:SAM-dependent methyltransferase